MRVLITGGTGYLGTAMSEQVPPGVEAFFAGRVRGAIRIDVTDETAVERVVARIRPDAIAHLAAVSRVEAAARDPDAAGDVNVAGAAAIARVAARSGMRLVAMSSDVVFDGREAPYDETSTPNPINPYGASKAGAEQAVLAAHPEALVVRTSVLVGRDRSDRFPFSSYVIERARSNRPIELFDNERRNFFPVTTAAACVWDLLPARVSGILHVATTTSLSRFGFGVRLLEGAGLDTSLAVATMGPSDRPSDLTLDVDRAVATLDRKLPTMDEAIAEVLADLGVP